MFDFLGSIWDLGSSIVTGAGDAAGNYFGGAVGAVVSGAVSGVITGALAGAAVSLIQGEDIKTGALRGAAIGGVAGGIMKGFSAYTDQNRIEGAKESVESDQANLVYEASPADYDSGVRIEAGPEAATDQGDSDGLFGIKGLSGASILKGATSAYQKKSEADALQEGREKLLDKEIAGESQLLKQQAEIDKAKVADNKPGTNTTTAWWIKRLTKENITQAAPAATVTP